LYRLVNVPTNPSGRFGAPETEPGLSGIDGEFITIPFTSGTDVIAHDKSPDDGAGGSSQRW
jgi:hypothetical protein